MSRARPSLAHLADKFNSSAPPGYVAGRGRGASGFSKPPPPEEGPKRGAASSSSAAPAPPGKSEPGTGLEGDAADTRELDLSETERFEQEELSMDNAEAGTTMEPFNMSSERREGSFDDDFNFVWKRKGEDPDDVQDAWLGEVDAQGESEEKVAKRKKLLKKQIDAQQEQMDEPPPDLSALLEQVASLLQPEETVASALRRLSGASQRRTVSAGGKRQRDADPQGADGDLEALLHKQQFDQLTEASDGLLRSGRFDIYSEKRERLHEELAKLTKRAPAEAGEGNSSVPQGAESSEAGINQSAHAAAEASGFVLDTSSGVYFNQESGLYYDLASGLYWPASGGGVYYYWDAAQGQFVPAEAPAPATAEAVHGEDVDGATEA
uniref:OCRE domain-containing protein n=1 Tax=Haptolina brevifila TaxID=156173 RepID=A0A7S2G2E7_9EUKA